MRNDISHVHGPCGCINLTLCCILFLNVNADKMCACRYVTAGTTWLTGAFSKVARAGNVAGTKTREKFNMAVSNLTSKVGYKLLPC